MRRSDVLLVDHPFPDGSGSKVRPVLVVSSDIDNARTANVVVATISKNLSRLSEPTHLLIDLATTEGQQSGLRINSVVIRNNLFTIHRRFVHKTIGSLPVALMNQIDTCLKSALALP